MTTRVQNVQNGQKLSLFACPPSVAPHGIYLRGKAIWTLSNGLVTRNHRAGSFETVRGAALEGGSVVINRIKKCKKMCSAVEKNVLVRRLIWLQLWARRAYGTPYFFGLVRKGTSGCRWGRRKRLRVFRGRSRKFDFTHVLFCCKKRAKINGENDGRSVRSAGSKLHPGVRRARVPCVLLFSAGRWFSLGRAPCGVTCFA